MQTPPEGSNQSAMKMVIVILSVIAFVVCLYIGFGLQKFFTLVPPQPTPTPAATVTRPAPQQHTLVLIQADDLTLAKPKLVGLWLLFYYPNYPKLTLLLLYPSMGGSDDLKARSLQQRFALAADGTLSPDFKAALVDNFVFKSNGYIVIDNYGVSQWIDWLGGISYSSQSGNQDGTAILNKLPPWGQDEKITGAWLKGVSNGVCQKIGQIPVDANWITLMNGIAPDHFHSDLSLDLTLSDWKQIKSQGGTITCELDIPPNKNN